MMKKIIIEIDIDEVKKILESDNDVTLKLTTESVSIEKDKDYIIEPELPEEVKRKLNWPF